MYNICCRYRAHPTIDSNTWITPSSQPNSPPSSKSDMNGACAGARLFPPRRTLNSPRGSPPLPSPQKLPNQAYGLCAPPTSFFFTHSPSTPSLSPPFSAQDSTRNQQIPSPDTPFTLGPPQLFFGNNAQPPSRSMKLSTWLTP